MKVHTYGTADRKYTIDMSFESEKKDNDFFVEFGCFIHGLSFTNKVACVTNHIESVNRKNKQNDK